MSDDQELALQLVCRTCGVAATGIATAKKVDGGTFDWPVCNTHAQDALRVGWLPIRDVESPTIDAPERRALDLPAIRDDLEYARDTMRTVFEHRGRLRSGPLASRVNMACHRLTHAIEALLAASSGERGAALEEAARVALSAQFPKQKWSCSDDASGTALTLNRFRRHIATAIRALATPATVEEPKV